MRGALKSIIDKIVLHFEPGDRSGWRVAKGIIFYADCDIAPGRPTEFTHADLPGSESQPRYVVIAAELRKRYKGRPIKRGELAKALSQDVGQVGGMLNLAASAGLVQSVGRQGWKPIVGNAKEVLGADKRAQRAADAVGTIEAAWATAGAVAEYLSIRDETARQWLCMAEIAQLIRRIGPGKWSPNLLPT
ncbi:MAG: hypothetical protein IID44_23625 [Planctomycetes bacterium]|nr:hypothetical protein [Planctomycetota bacterium]